MFKYYFENIENIERGPVISLVIFFVFFVGLIIYILRVDKKHINRMKNMPLDENENADWHKTESTHEINA